MVFALNAQTAPVLAGFTKKVSGTIFGSGEEKRCQGQFSAVGSISVRLTATEPEGLSVSMVFVLNAQAAAVRSSQLLIDIA